MCFDNFINDFFNKKSSSVEIHISRILTYPQLYKTKIFYSKIGNYNEKMSNKSSRYITFEVL